MMKKKPVKIRNKYYVAAAHVTSDGEQAQDNTAKNVALSVPRVNPPHTGGSAAHHEGKWTRRDLKDAIKHAEQILEAQPNRDHVTIVKIVRVVRRKKAPVVVEVV